MGQLGFNKAASLVAVAAGSLFASQSELQADSAFFDMDFLFDNGTVGFAIIEFDLDAADSNADPKTFLGINGITRYFVNTNDFSPGGSINYLAGNVPSNGNNNAYNFYDEFFGTVDAVSFTNQNSVSAIAEPKTLDGFNINFTESGLFEFDPLLSNRENIVTAGQALEDEFSRVNGKNVTLIINGVEQKGIVTTLDFVPPVVLEPSVPFAITEAHYAPDAEPSPILTLTWGKTGAASYAVKYSRDLSYWGDSLQDGITPAMDENPTDTDYITVTFALTNGLENAAKMFFRIEEE